MDFHGEQAVGALLSIGISPMRVKLGELIAYFTTTFSYLFTTFSLSVMPSPGASGMSK